MESIIQEIVQCSFEGKNVIVNTNEIEIVFDDDKSFKFLAFILIWNIPYFNTFLNTNLKDATDRKIHLKGFTSELFKNCLNKLMSVSELNEIISLTDIPLDKFSNSMKILKMYHDKFDYLGIEKGCVLINKLISSNNIIINNLKKLGIKNDFFSIETIHTTEETLDKYQLILDTIENVMDNYKDNTETDICVDTNNISNILQSLTLTNDQTQELLKILKDTFLLISNYSISLNNHRELLIQLLKIIHTKLSQNADIKN